MADALLRLDGVIKRFGGLTAADGVALTVQPGEIHALIGPNGAGKTTLVHLISGALHADAGEVWFAGADITALSMHQRVKRGLARSYQVTSIFRRLSVLENAALAVQPGAGSSLRFWTPAGNTPGLLDAARDMLARVGLSARADAMAGSLAHGEQRQLEVALALATRPRLLLLDEPMAGMGGEESARMVELIAELREHVTLLLIEHDMAAVFKLADRISVLVSGRVIATGSAQEIRASVEVRRAYLGDELAA